MEVSGFEGFVFHQFVLSFSKLDEVSGSKQFFGNKGSYWELHTKSSNGGNLMHQKVTRDKVILTSYLKPNLFELEW